MNLRWDQRWERRSYDILYNSHAVQTYPGPGTHGFSRGRVYDRLQMIVGGPNPYSGSILQTQVLRTING
jgi:hypothetical protein